MLRRALLRSAQRRNSGCSVSFLLRFLAVVFTNEFQQLRSRNWPTGGLLGSGADSLADFSKSLFWLLATQHYQRLIKSLLNNIVYWDYWLHPVWPSAVQDGWSQSHHQAVCNAEPCLNNLQIASHALTTVEDHSAASGSWSNLAPIRCGTKWGSQHGRNRVKPAESAGPIWTLFFIYSLQSQTSSNAIGPMLIHLEPPECQALELLGASFSLVHTNAVWFLSREVGLNRL